MTTRNRVLLPLSALLVAALIAGLTWAVSSRDRDPEVLRLLGAGGTATRDMAAPAASRPEGQSSASGAYKLTGELPEGQPEDAPVYALAGPYDTSRLTKALAREGLTTDHAAWWWSPYCSTSPTVGAPEPADGREDSPDGKSMTVCAVARGDTATSGSGSGTAVDPDSPVTTVAPQPTGAPEPEPSTKPEPPQPVPAPGTYSPSPEPTTPAMSEAQARTAAQPVFEAVDLPIADATVSVTPYGASVWLNPIVHGLRTAGYTTRVELDRNREITWATGFLGDLARGDTYPLITAKEAFDSIDSPAVTDMMCRVGPDEKGCLAPPQPEITGAELGLQLRQTGAGEQVLVPAWLFTVKDWTEPFGQVAVADKYLGEPEPTEPPVKDPGGGQTEPGGGSDGSDGSVPPPTEDKPSSIEPAPPTRP